MNRKETMQALWLTGRRQLECRESERPRVEDTAETPAEQATMIVRVEAVSVCNSTDYRIFDAEDPAKVWPYQPWPFIPGHEVCGTVVEKGPLIEGWELGDRIVGWCPPFGGFAEYCRLYGNFMVSIKVPPHWPAWRTCILEMAIGACRMLVDGDGSSLLPPGSKAAVIGCGPAGLFYVQLARLLGATTVAAIGRHPFRLERARRLGADPVLEDGPEVYERLWQAIGPVDVILNTAGADLREPFARILKPDGLLAPYGVGFDWNGAADDWRGRGFRLAGGGQEEARAGARLIRGWVESNALRLDPLVTHRVRLEDLPRLLPEIKSRPDTYLKVVAELPEET